MNDQSEESGEADEHAAAAAPIITHRLILRAPLERDAEAIAALAGSRKIAEQTSRIPHPYSLADAVQWISGLKEGDERAFLVTCKSDGTILGVVGAMDVGEGDDKSEIGYWIGEPYWGQGFATEAAQAVIDHTFHCQPVEQFLGRCRVANAASRQVLVKCGFQFAGTGMCPSRVYKGLVASEEFVLERSVWESLKRWGKAS